MGRTSHGVNFVNTIRSRISKKKLEKDWFTDLPTAVTTFSEWENFI